MPEDMANLLAALDESVDYIRHPPAVLNSYLQRIARRAHANPTRRESEPCTQNSDRLRRCHSSQQAHKEDRLGCCQYDGEICTFSGFLKCLHVPTRLVYLSTQQIRFKWVLQCYYLLLELTLLCSDWRKMVPMFISCVDLPFLITTL
jgi:hypothetical protein